MNKTFVALCMAALPMVGWTTSLTIYNQNFALVKETVSLSLNGPMNQISYSNITYGVEPESVLLRPNQPVDSFRILEQTYLSEPVSQNKLLDYYEGETIDFIVTGDQGAQRIIQGKIVRSGKQSQQTPMIEVDGKLRFGLPGTPLFPSTEDDLLLKPTLVWKIQSNEKTHVDAQLSYLTSGAKWESTYNLVVNQKDESKVALVGWVTLTNNTGKDFENASIRLMAGDVNRVNSNDNDWRERKVLHKAAMLEDAPAVSSESLDEFHLYTIGHATNLSSGETKQVEFIRADSVEANKRYVFDGATVALNRSGDLERLSDVAVYREFENVDSNGLGVALPKGKIKFYQENQEGELEFIGENRIQHTPKNEKISVFVGNAFDVKGKRIQKSYQTEKQYNKAKETIEITLKNRKEENIEIQVIETLNRYGNWKIVNSSSEFSPMDSQRVKFLVSLKANEEKVISYTVEYQW